jgi:hypothetical protein
LLRLDIIKNPGNRVLFFSDEGFESSFCFLMPKPSVVVTIGSEKVSGEAIMGEIICLSPCKWASISKELTWKYMALCGKTCPTAELIDEEISGYSILDNDSRVTIGFDKGQAVLIKQTIREMLDSVGPLAGALGLYDEYSLTES